MSTSAEGSLGLTEITPEIADVVEQHRAKYGYEKMGITTGPGVTPESVRDALEETERQVRNFNESLSEVEILKGRLAYAHDKLRKVGRLSQTNARDIMAQHPDVTRIKKEIFRVTDMVDVIDMRWILEYTRLRKEGKRDYEAFKILNGEKNESIA